MLTSSRESVRSNNTEAWIERVLGVAKTVRVVKHFDLLKAEVGSEVGE
ncbi:MAG: hypothetical protein KJO52_07055 [Maribacter sp.]|nr:hypothetical protein [Maribacter sp.]